MRGRIYEDQNRNGAADEGEPGIGNTEMSLEPAGALAGRRTTWTDAAGVFVFDAVAAGRYLLSMTLPAGYLALGPTQQIVDVAGDVTLQTDFGLRVAPPRHYLPLLWR